MTKQKEAGAAGAAKLRIILAELLGRPVDATPSAVDLAEAVATVEEHVGLLQSQVGDNTRQKDFLMGEMMLDPSLDDVRDRIGAREVAIKAAEEEIARLTPLLALLRRRASEASARSRDAKIDAGRDSIDAAEKVAMVAAAAVDAAVDGLMNEMLATIVASIRGTATAPGLMHYGDRIELNHMPATNAQFLQDLIARRAAAHVRGVTPLPSMAATVKDICVVARRSYEAAQGRAA